MVQAASARAIAVGRSSMAATKVTARISSGMARTTSTKACAAQYAGRGGEMLPAARMPKGTARVAPATVAPLGAVDYPENNFPLPHEHEQVAAHRATESTGRREQEAPAEPGEESQERSE